MIAFYYGLTGFACAIYWRRELSASVKNFLFIGVAPLIGAPALAYLLYRVGDRPLRPEGLLLRHSSCSGSACRW